MFNHAREPNVSYRRDKKANTIEYTTTKLVLPGQELCIYYGSDDKLWFKMEDSIDCRDSGESIDKTPRSSWEDMDPLPFNDLAGGGGGCMPASVIDEPTSGEVESDNRPLFELIRVLSVEEQEEAEGMPISTSELVSFSGVHSTDACIS
jgi:tRNA-specific adenosine deaminase 3